jgi:TolA-binding protein
MFLAACAPLIELEDENVALHARVDSLEIVLAECNAQTLLFQERLSTIERENLQLDDRNRQFAAKLAELQYGRVPEEQQGMATAGERATMPSVTPVPASGERTPDYRAGTAPDLPFLREYQSALSAYNSKEYARAARLFSGLLMTSSPNDMIDNCVYWLGETQFQLGQLDQAYGRFTTVLDYERSDKTAAALLSRARVSLALERKEDARADLQRCIKDFPLSEQAETAKQLLRKI